MPDSKPMRADVRRNREAIIAAARAAFGRGEFDRRFDDFAALAGVGVGTLYRHFPTRDALAEAVYRDEVDALCAHARQLLAELPPADALAAFLRDYVRRIGTEGGLARTLATLMQHRPDTQADGGRALADALAALVDAAARDGGLETPLNAGALVMLLHGIGSTYGQPTWQADAEQLITAVVRPPRRLPTTHG